ncbi:MAG: SurA N-terminal domain-containing protein [Ferrovibrio sp.]|uniref:peptidylprolyl isomerase n=1 Tax=Ferrovibrio sp. TaxID=1917215 RepID=UPI0026368FFC|nr:peptidylprolyl isomerase [Ferrovibrio sp.]MCW0231998.1 SurA N-terminal domain-containing protein [Ferrovibrio sp.]
MLQQMRSGAASWIAKGLMILLVFSFAIWGIADYVRGFGSSGDVAKVGSATIGQAEFAEALRREVNALRRQFGPAFSTEQARQLGLDETALNRMIEDRLYVQAASNLGISASDAQVRDMIMNAPAFKGMGGQFDRLAFEQYLRNEGYSEGRLVAVLREDIARTQLLGSLFGSVVQAPTPMVNAVLQYRLQRRLAEYIVIDPARLPAPAAPGDAQIEEYYKANPAAFTAPERRTVAWFDLTAAQRAAVMTVDDEEIREEYNANQRAYVTPEKRSIEQVVFTTEAEAKAAAEAIAKGESFAAMAARTQKLKPEDLSLGLVTKNDLPAAIANAAFALEKDKVSEPVISPFGFHLLRVTAIEAGATRSFDEVKTELRNQIGLRKAADGMVKLRQQIDDQIAGGATLEEIAKAQTQPIKQADAIDAQGSDATGKPLEALPKVPAFLSETFDLGPDAEPHIIDTADGGLIVLKVLAIQPAALKPLADVKPQVVAALTERARAEAATERAKQIAERLRSGGDLAREAAGIGATMQLSAPLTRGGQPAERSFSPAVLGAVFNARQVGEIVTGPAAAPAGGAIVARLSRIEEPDAALVARQQDQTAQQLAGGMTQDLVQQYKQLLQKEIGVSINAAARAQAANF